MAYDGWTQHEINHDGSSYWAKRGVGAIRLPAYGVCPVDVHNKIIQNLGYMSVSETRQLISDIINSRDN